MTLDRLQWPWPLYFKRVFLLTGLSINTPVISPALWSFTGVAASLLLVLMILQVAWTANWLYQHRLDSQTLKRDISPIIVARLCEGNDTDHRDVMMIIAAVAYQLRIPLAPIALMKPTALAVVELAK